MRNRMRQYLVACSIGIMALGVCSTALAGEARPTPSLRAGGPPGNFNAEYIDCDEFAGVGLVPLANVVDRVPNDYVIIEPVPGLAVVVAQAGSCEEIRVDGGWSQPGTFAQFGVAVVPPLAPGNGDFYQVLFATDHSRLATNLRRLGVQARHDPQLSYEINDEPVLSVEISKPPKLAFELNGPITLPDPAAPANPTSVFNYYAQTEHFGNVLQQNVVEGIRFGEGSAVMLVAIGSEMQAIIGGNILMFPFFSNPEVFDRTDLVVTTNAF